MPTVERILELAPTCCRLAEDHKWKRAIFSGVPKSSQNQAILIYIYYKILNEIYTRDNDYPGLQAPANYLWELCQKFGFKAANIVDGGGSGQIAPVTPTVRPTRIDFIVSASSFMITGQSTRTMPVTWDGYDLDMYRGGLGQSQVTTEPTYFTYDTASRALEITPALVEGELISLIPV